MEETKKEESTLEDGVLPLLPLRGVTAFPGVVLNFEVERPISITALNAALNNGQDVFLVSQLDSATMMPEPQDMYDVGTVCSVRQVLRMPGTNMVRVMVEGLCRARIRAIREQKPFYLVEVEQLETGPVRTSGVKREALVRHCVSLFEEYANVAGIMVPERFLRMIGSDDMGRVADFVAQHVLSDHQQKQMVLEELRPVRRIELVNRLVRQEINIQNLEKDLDEGARQEMDRATRDYYLREQMKLIRQELGEGENEGVDEFDDYRMRVSALGLEPEIEKKLLKEVERLSRQPFGSSEGALLRNYLDVCLELPWNTRTKDTVNVQKARAVLDEDHYGMEKVKDRIVEFLAVRQLAPDMRGGVICLVGPPGVGKTSVAMSIARATNRKLCRISLGGVHDEAEIRGHRKTYIGAMPGRIVAALQQAGSLNPVMVLDEIDKLGSDYRGDPSAALLEALDGEQNGSFRDHFLEIPIDLRDVLFITTANTLDTVPRALLDRMEVIQLGSYTDEEKLQIAREHLLPKQRKKHGLTAARLRISDDAIRELIAEYTRESGVRVLERQIAALCRKAARNLAEGEGKSVSVRAGQVEKFLGPAKYKDSRLYPKDEVGLVRGLAWTSVGGEVLDVEAGVMEGTGKLDLTGNLGDVMKESARAAVTYIRTRSRALGIDPEFYKNKDIHIHFPEGAVPKDGPSAGITITIAVISALTGIPARRDVAMTGEISLRGRVMPIGGLREKTMAALRTGIHNVIIPAENERDLEEIDPLVRKALNFITTDHVDKILDVALTRRPEPALELPEQENVKNSPPPLALPELEERGRPGLRQ
ncbi:MAG: endopeptidase La [Oscillospiraceae bacterium]|nr:endopeptidase La [Oscillospiraceae bacterium]